MNTKLQSIFVSIMEGDQTDVENGVHDALEEGVSPVQILNEAMISAMQKVGKKYERGEFFVPEMLVAARAMKGGLEILRPLLREADVKPAGKIVIGTVQGDLHDIGKNLVAMMLEGAGFEIYDLGTDVPSEKFVQSIQANSADLVGLSALLTTTMTNMKGTINAIEVAGLHDKVKIIVGGAPVTEAFAKQIGADGYAPDASRAVTVAKSLLTKQ